MFYLYQKENFLSFNFIRFNGVEIHNIFKMSLWKEIENKT